MTISETIQKAVKMPWNKGLRIKPLRSCDICGISNPRISFYSKFQKTLCDKHYWHFKIHGVTSRTSFDKNEIDCSDGICRMKLYNRKGEVMEEALFDEDLLSIIKNYKWSIRDSYGYVRNSRWEYLHHFVLPKHSELVVDHINGNTFDNRRSNLRYLTAVENMQLGRERHRIIF